MKRFIVFAFVISFLIVGCTWGTSITEKIKAPIKATHSVISKAIPILQELANSEALSDEYKATLSIVADGAVTVKAILEKVAVIIGLDLTETVVETADVKSNIDKLKEAIEELKKLL